MEWITNNWILLLIVALCIGMYFFGHGCCSHGKHGEDSKEGSDLQKGNANACSSDGSTTKKGGCCH